MSEAGPTATTSGLPESRLRAAVWGRRLGVAVLTLIVAADLVGALGVHTSTQAASGADGYHLSLDYPGIARPGLDVVWRARVDHPGGFDAPITLAITGDYLSIYETQGFHPKPSAETRDGHDLLLTFDPPPHDTFVLDYDAYIQPSSQAGRTARVGVVVADSEVVGVTYKTRLVP